MFFCSYDRGLDPMTFIYEIDPYCMEIYHVCKYKLPMSRLLKVIITYNIYWILAAKRLD